MCEARLGRRQRVCAHARECTGSFVQELNKYVHSYRSHLQHSTSAATSLGLRVQLLLLLLQSRTWCDVEAVGLVVKVDVHDCRSCRAQGGRQHALPVRQLAFAKVAELLTPAQHQ